MNIGSAAVGYGYYNAVSTMDRIKGAALGQDDKHAADAYYYTCIRRDMEC